MDAQIKGSIIGMDLSNTGDQVVTISAAGKFIVRGFILGNCSAPVTTYRTLKLYTGPNATGDLVGGFALPSIPVAGQYGSGVSGATVAAVNGTLYARLSTPPLAGATGDLFVFGVDLP